MRDSRLCHGKSMDYLGNNKWSFERIPNVQGSWLQVTGDQLINCRLEEVTLETECANCTISSPIGDIPGGINGSVSHNLVTIVWKESLREVQQCKLRLVETGIAQRYLTNNSEIERIRDVEQQLDFVYNTTNKEYCNSSEKSYKQVIGMDKVILRLHSLTDTNAHPSKPLEEDIEKIADIIRAEISGAAHSQYARDRTTDGINGVAREIRALQCENRVLAHKTAIATAQHSGWLAASYLNLPTCSKLIATGESISVYQCSPKNSTITTEITSCGPQPKLGDYTLDTEGWELTPYTPCYWHKNFVNINGRAHFYKNSSWHPIVPGVIIQGHSLINTLPYEIDKLLALSLHPALTPHPMSTAAAIAEIIAAAKEEHSIDLGNPFHMSTLLSSLQKEKNVSLSSKILSWSSSLIARYIPCCSFLSTCNPFTCFTKTSDNDIEVGHPALLNPSNPSPPITIVNLPASVQQPAPELFAPSAPFLQREPPRNKFHRDALRQAHREAAFDLHETPQTHTSTSDLKSTATIVSNKENMNAVFSGKSALNCNADSNLIVIASVVAPVVLTTEGNLSKKTVYMTGVETCSINSQCEYAEKAQSVTPSTDPEATAQVSSRNQNANSGKFEININNMIAREKISKNRSATKRKFCCLPWHNTEKTSTSKDYVQLNNLGVADKSNITNTYVVKNPSA
ncbi:hypothetical protein OUZ56_016662 [Daphnia magna]|uniref:Uncharacterized protein n=1 Tax=Daphnia magna TaxID=35525 RepID=A0ABR0AR72_9CRUS|nr:hypothetical protein OUZ56_016662 [Daphnia magna]